MRTLAGDRSAGTISTRRCERPFRLLAFLLLVSALGCKGDSIGFAGHFIRVAPQPIAKAFLSPDQQGRAILAAGEPRRAAAHFGNPLWKGIAFSRAGDFSSAARIFSKLETARGDFMQGNALARADQLPEAALAYQRALARQADFPEAAFNLDWVLGLIAVSETEYEDFGGTGGQLEADEIVFDDRARNAISEMTVREARAQGLSAEAIREMWMRRVQTTPGDFLRRKLAYQAAVSAENGGL